MSFWRNVSPGGAARDFWQVWTANPYRWPVLGTAMLATLGLMWIIIPKSERIPPERPTITYITTFDSTRSDSEIRAANIESQKQQDALAAEAARREEARKDLYRQLGRMSGIDVDRMERDINREKAAEQAAARSGAAGAQPLAGQ